MTRPSSGLPAHAGSANRRSRLPGAMAERPAVMLASSPARDAPRRATVPGRRARLVPKRSVDPPGRNRRSTPRAASDSSRSSGLAAASAASARPGSGSRPLRRGHRDSWEPRPAGPSASARRATPLPGSAPAAHLAAEDLAGRALRQLVHQPDVPRVLVGGDPLLHERPQLVRRGRGARLERDRRAHLLAERVVRDPDHGRLGDRRMLVQDLLDLPRVDVVPAADDQLLLAVHDEEVAVLVDPARSPVRNQPSGIASAVASGFPSSPS